MCTAHKKVALICPGDRSEQTKGRYINPVEDREMEMECSVMTILVESDIRVWQQKICESFDTRIKLPFTT